MNYTNLRKTISIILISLMLTGCWQLPFKKTNSPPEIWWGKKGDIAEWEKARQMIMEKDDWVVQTQKRWLNK